MGLASLVIWEGDGMWQAHHSIASLVNWEDHEC